MSDEFSDEPSDIQDLTQIGREKLAEAQGATKDALTATTDYIRANPWVAVAGAAVIGGVIAALSRPHRREPTKFEAVREWLDDAYAKLPTPKQVHAMAENCGVTDTIRQIRRKLHLD